MALRLLNAITATTSAPSNTFATGTITCVSGANLVDGETFTIRRGGLSYTFEYDSNASWTATSGTVRIVFAGGDTATQVATATAAAITGCTALGYTAVGSVATVTITANVAGPDYNAAVTENVVNGSFAVTDITGGAFAGFSLNGIGNGPYAQWNQANDAGLLWVKGAGTGALTFQGVLWLYSPLIADWAPAGISSTIADRGKLNDGTTITGTTTLVHVQPYVGLSAATRIALQATTLTGTGMTVSAYLVPRRGT